MDRHVTIGKLKKNQREIMKAEIMKIMIIIIINMMKIAITMGRHEDLKRELKITGRRCSNSCNFDTLGVIPNGLPPPGLCLQAPRVYFHLI